MLACPLRLTPCLLSNNAKVKPIRDEDGLAVDFEIEGEYPQFGNNDSRVDDMAVDLVERFMKKIQKLTTYRNAIPTQSV